MESKIQRLSEGMDFIEESYGYGEPLTFSEVTDSSIQESDRSHESPYRVLGVCRGNFQPIGEFSRNKRLYSNDLWPTVLENEEFKNRLASRSVFGCIGHEDKLVDDTDIREGKVSHIVTKLEVREDLNHKPFLYGELEILDTPSGRILEAMYKGGANLYVSSRAAGKLYPVPGQNYSLVKPETYHVHCFDVVARPGFLQAKPAFEAVTEEPKQPVIKESEEVPVVCVSTTTANWAPVVTEEALKNVEVTANEEISELKAQVEKLAQVIEKVVDDVYEVPEEKKEEPVKIPEALDDFFSLMAETNISDEAMQEILHAIFNDKEGNK